MMLNNERNQYRSALVPPWGWRGTFAEFCELSLSEFLNGLLRHAQCRWGDAPISMEQVDSWILELEILQPLLKGFIAECPDVSMSVITFEYELILERGDRPDVVLSLPNSTAIVIECKNRSKTRRSDISQVCAYARKLELFQSVRSARPILLLLQQTHDDSKATKEKIKKGSNNIGQEQPVFDFDADAHDVPVCDTSPQGMARLTSILRSEFRVHGDCPQTLGIPSEHYTPSHQVIASVCQSLGSIARKSHMGESPLQQAVNRVLQAQGAGEHILMVIPGETRSGKTLFGMQLGARFLERGLSSLYLTGDCPLPEDVSAYIEQISKLSGEFEATAFIRKLSSFSRVTTRRDTQLPFGAVILDNTGVNAIYPESLLFPSFEPALFGYAEAQEWCAIVVVLDFESEFWSATRATLSDAVRCWFQSLLIQPRERRWRFVCPQPFGVEPSQTVKHGVSLIFDGGLYLGAKSLPTPPLNLGGEPLDEAKSHFNCMQISRTDCWKKFKSRVWSRFCDGKQITSENTEFQWSMELLTHRKSTDGACLIHELATHGYLNKVPSELLNWEVLSLEEETLGRTPIRHAAKYGFLNQIPLSVVATHVSTITPIVMAAVDDSRIAGRTDRRINAIRWLIKIVISSFGKEAANSSEVLQFVRELAEEAVRQGSLVPVPDPKIMNHLRDDAVRRAIEHFVSLGEEGYIDAAIFTEYVTAIEKGR